MVEAKVVAPVPWFPLTLPAFGGYAAMARTPVREVRSGIFVAHPRYVVIPKVGMTAAPSFLYAATLPLMKRLEREWGFDLIDAHYFYPDGVVASWLGRALNKPVVITARGTDVNLIPRYRAARRMIVNAAHRAAGIIAVSRALKDALIELGVSDGHIEVLRNGVDLEMFQPDDRVVARASLGIKRRTLLSVGHLIERKGHDIAIEALRYLPDYQLLLAGQGPEQSNLKSLATRLGVHGRVRFLGSVPHEELRTIYSAADALVLASSREGWPNVLLEAMACGTPVVASPVWGNPEIVSSPDAGVLMRSRTAEGLSEAVNSLFASLPDRNATRAFAEKFSWVETSQGQVRLFQRILQEREAGMAP
jgi:glycosyltransferase involved in cell wall biosynthesis